MKFYGYNSEHAATIEKQNSKDAIPSYFKNQYNSVLLVFPTQNYACNSPFCAASGNMKKQLKLPLENAVHICAINY